MNDFYILERAYGTLLVETCASAVGRISRLLEYPGACIYFPSPDKEHRRVLLAIDPNGAASTETDRFLRTLAGELSLSVLTPDGVSAFLGTPDNDISFIDMLPAPEDECLPIRLVFGIADIREDDIIRRMHEFFAAGGYEADGENDGITVFLGANSYLDIFYKSGDDHVSGDIDCTISGAGIYADAVRLIEELSKHLSGRCEFFEIPALSYTADRDFEKLRLAFYAPIAQQLAFAINDDRDGMPAYLGWGTDAFEPEFIPGTIVAPFGRFSIDKLLSEIQTYGFSYVCDKNFLTRNTSGIGADTYIKEALSVLWNTSAGGKEGSFTVPELFTLSECERWLEAALSMGDTVPFPKELYRRICGYNNHKMADFSKNPDMELHFTPGYFSGEIGYGFGHYLRRFKLPGTLSRDELLRGEDVIFYSPGSGFKLLVNISYGYTGDGSESNLGDNFAKTAPEDIEIFDIGGSSVVRFADGGFSDGLWRAEAEVYILDEVYRFAMTASDRDDVCVFRDALRGALSVEDWYDEVIREECPDPHAPGATFCTNGAVPPYSAFEKPFPEYPAYLEKEAFDLSGMSDIMGSLMGEASGDYEKILQGFIGGIVNELNREFDDANSDDAEDDLQ